MPSPFPGMDPYLEQYWREVHQSLVVYARDMLQPRLPPDLRVRVEERVYLESDSGEYRVVYPDVHVVEHPRGGPAVAEAEAGAAAALEEEPLILHLDSEPLREGYLEIVDAGSGNRVITVIEFLSPSNKFPGDGQQKYLAKQREVLAAGASLVEVDLTRSGQRVIAAPVERIPRSHRTPYQVCVRRSWRPECAEIYRVPLARRLPMIRIPLRQSDADVKLDLQSLVDLCYQNGRYDDLDYRAAPNPPLDAADAAWADQLLREKGLR